MNVRHIKTGRDYEFFGFVSDCTNARDGALMALYGDGQRAFVRDLHEFLEKFEASDTSEAEIDAAWPDALEVAA